MRTHGLRSTYTAGCRCTPCTDANSDYQMTRYALGRVPAGGKHGLGGYNSYGCRCEVCRLAKSEANAARYPDSVRNPANADA